MKKIQHTLVLVSFGLAFLLYLLDLTKITTKTGGVTIHLYPVAAFALLGLVLLWRMFKQRYTVR